MKLAIGSLIVQLVLIKITSHLLFNFLLTFAALLFAIALWQKQSRISLFALRLFVFTLALRFLLIFSLLINHWIDQQFIEPETQQKMAQLESATSEEKQKQQQLIQIAQTKPFSEENSSFIDSFSHKLNGWKDSISSTMQQVSNTLDIKKHIKKLSAKLDRIGMDLITLMSLFLLKTLILPLLILWLLLKLLQKVWQIKDLPFIIQPNLEASQKEPHKP